MFLSIFENLQMRPPTALEELKKHRGMIAMSMELSTNTGCTQGLSHSTVKTNLGIEQKDMGEKLSHADALAFVSGPDVMQNDHDPTQMVNNQEILKKMNQYKRQNRRDWFWCIK